jgi:PASTA domain
LGEQNRTVYPPYYYSGCCTGNECDVEAVYLDENGGAPLAGQTPILSCKPAEVAIWKPEDNVVHTDQSGVEVDLCLKLPKRVLQGDPHWFESFDVFDDNPEVRRDKNDRRRFDVKKGGTPTVFAFYLGGVDVPRVINRTLDDANDKLTHAHLVGAVKERRTVLIDPEPFYPANPDQEDSVSDKDPPSAYGPPGTPFVWDQDPQPGTNVPRGSTVNLSVEQDRYEKPSADDHTT